ncbi:MAG TPA: acylphosphatase [Bacteroidales bacterium]|nr:acylphosphatase [Bacteroidales bacterium]
MNEKAVAITITGRVQNIGFRYHARKQAQELALAGFVRNCLDGSVYVEAQGPADALESFILWCHQGPSWARVDNVQMQEIPVSEYNSFEVK